MAAHVFTAIQQIEDELLKAHEEGHLYDRWSHLQAAVDLSTWTEDLELEHYYSLRDIIQSGNDIRLALWLGEMKVLYRKLWANLEQPRTREEWRQKLLYG